MVGTKLIKAEIVVTPMRGKPTKFRFKGNIRLGFRKGKVVEIVKFKKIKK